MKYAIVTLHYEIGLLQKKIISCKAQIENCSMGFYDTQSRENYERDLALAEQRIPELKEAINHLQTLASSKEH